MLDVLQPAQSRERKRRVVREQRTGNAGPIRFARISGEMDRILAERDKLVMDTFAELEASHRDLAEMLVCHAGSRLRAARWMCSRQAQFGGRSAYDILADGDADAIWDCLSR